MHFHFSVIITCYNQARTLRFLLASLERQTILSAQGAGQAQDQAGDQARNQTRNQTGQEAFEVIVADDGSSDETAELCRESRKFPIRRISQEDQGYRKSRILNQAIRQAKSEYLLFLDADVILGKHFLQDHLSLRRAHHLVCGRRVDLGPMISQRLTLDDVLRGKFDSLSWAIVLSGLKGDSTLIKRGWRVVQPWLRGILGYDRPIDLLGSNFSAWKADIIAVNGFNEALESYWGEDGDLFIRLKNAGKSVIGAKALCIQFHVFHPRRIPTQENIEFYKAKLRDEDYKWAPKGYKESS